MNGKLVVKTGLITAAVIAALAYFSYNASYNPDFSAIDFITAASPKKKAKNRKDVQETVYSLQDFDLSGFRSTAAKPRSAKVFCSSTSAVTAYTGSSAKRPSARI